MAYVLQCIVDFFKEMDGIRIFGKATVNQSQC